MIRNSRRRGPSWAKWRLYCDSLKIYWRRWAARKLSLFFVCLEASLWICFVHILYLLSSFIFRSVFALLFCSSIHPFSNTLSNPQSPYDLAFPDSSGNQPSRRCGFFWKLWRPASSRFRLGDELGVRAIKKIQYCKIWSGHKCKMCIGCVHCINLGYLNLN